MHTYQNMVLALTQFWANHGCLYHQPYDLETGAATFNPITFLKVLGPEPYNAAYVEPCRRPQDGRYGQNPNRLQLFHQFQVILKPSPKDVLDLYLKSLEAIGFDLKQHDIRFVHDDWESPTLGAWGLGWEVWMDGMEVTQFTYFQSVAGFALKPVTAEIAYGLERLSMLLQNKQTFFDMQYDHRLTYRDVILQNEIEWSTYNFEKADTAMWFQHFNQFEAEAKRLIACKLPIPAYDFVVKASHAFNILEARGVISTTERTGYILRIRELSRLAATGYIASREELNFPLCRYLKHPAAKPAETSILPSLGKVENFLFEIGCEMLPSDYVSIGENSLKKGIETLLSNHRLTYSHIETFATPQRLAILVHQLATLSAPMNVERKGPLVQAAFDGSMLTSLGAGFLKSLKIDSPVTLDAIAAGEVSGLSIKRIQDQDYLYVKQSSGGKATFDILKEDLKTLIASMVFPKNMRWDHHDETFARPIRWIVAMLGKAVIPFSYADVVAGNKTRGHAQYCPYFFDIINPLDYDALLKEHYVIASMEERKKSIESQLEKIEKAHQAVAVRKNRVLKEVVNLVEWPKLAVYHFDSHFLEAPKELLVSEMIEHQRYFPLEDASSKLKPLFVMTLDHESSECVLNNNQKVLSARLSDGVFLYRQDLKEPLETYLEKLKTVSFQKDLGTVYEKVQRIEKHSHLLHRLLKVGDQEVIHRSSLLCKADLATHLVKEFPELQGIVGKIYALHQGEHPEVAQAIQEHWLPNAENGPLPQTAAGKILALADKFDNLAGYYSVGIRPSSSSDPYALRRQTLGILKILIDAGFHLSLQTVLHDVFRGFSDHDFRQVIAEMIEFFKNRMKTLLEDSHHRKDHIEAIIAAHFDNPYDDLRRLRAFEQFYATDSFKSLHEVYKRLKGQVEKCDRLDCDAALFSTSEERNLFDYIERVESLIHAEGYHPRYEVVFNLLAGLQQPLKALFDHVKIMADDKAVQNNRQGLLQKAYRIMGRYADLSKVQL